MDQDQIIVIIRIGGSLFQMTEDRMERFQILGMR